MEESVETINDTSLDSEGNVNDENSEEVDSTNERHSPEELKKWTLWAAASYAFVMLIIGLPLWWHTTTVQRVPLPYDQMLTMNEFFVDNLRISIPIHFKGFALSSERLLEINRIYQVEGNLNTKFDYKLTPMSSEEGNVIKTGKTLEEIDALLCAKGKVAGESDLNFYHVGRADLIQSQGTSKVVLGNCKSLYYLSISPKLEMDEIWKVFQQFAVPTVTSDSFGMNSKEFQLPLSAGYDILWSLLIPEPELNDASLNIEAGIKKYIKPMLEKLEAIAEFSLRSQNLYYVNLNVKPKLNPSTEVFEVPYEQLPLVINPVESKLTSFVSQNPALNFLIYISPCAETPMHILNEEGKANWSNSFLVPRWGGIQMYNIPCSTNATTSTRREKHEVSVEQVMSVVISQFRSLIGVQEMSETKILNFHGSALRDWEVDLIVRKRLISLIFTASNTLKSLGNLLDQITNIVVREQVGQEVEKSVTSLKLAFEACSIGKLNLAQRHALESYKSSEIAFHHPSNLAQLYFPDDQKYAIYIPLFLPVGIPVLLSLRLIFQEFMAHYKKAKVE